MNIIVSRSTLKQITRREERKGPSYHMFFLNSREIVGRDWIIGSHLQREELDVVPDRFTTVHYCEASTTYAKMKGNLPKLNYMKLCLKFNSLTPPQSSSCLHSKFCFCCQIKTRCEFPDSACSDCSTQHCGDKCRDARYINSENMYNVDQNEVHR